MLVFDEATSAPVIMKQEAQVLKLWIQLGRDLTMPEIIAHRYKHSHFAGSKA